MLGVFNGMPGARRWRQIMTVDAIRPGAGVETVLAALAAITPSVGPSSARSPAPPVLAFA
jgi:tRNA-dihydrouridine synthase A